MYQQFFGQIFFLHFLPAPNFEVFLDFENPFLTEVDFSWFYEKSIRGDRHPLS